MERCDERSGVEAVGESAAVDIEGFEDANDGIRYGRVEADGDPNLHRGVSLPDGGWLAGGVQGFDGFEFSTPVAPAASVGNNLPRLSPRTLHDR